MSQNAPNFTDEQFKQYSSSKLLGTSSILKKGLNFFKSQNTVTKCVYETDNSLWIKGFTPLFMEITGLRSVQEQTGCWRLLYLSCWKVLSLLSLALIGTIPKSIVYNRQTTCQCFPYNKTNITYPY